MQSEIEKEIRENVKELETEVNILAENISDKVKGAISVKEKVTSKTKQNLVNKLFNLKYFVGRKILNLAFKLMINKDSGFLQHAKREFEFIKLDKSGYNKWMIQNITDLLKMLSIQRHSQTLYDTLDSLKKLATFQPLTPLTFEEDEWLDVSEACGEESMYQNIRMSNIFKHGIDGKPYSLDAILWIDDDGVGFNGTINGYSSCQYVKIPFIPKTFRIDVVLNKKTNDYEIKNLAHMLKVFRYYEKGMDATIKK